LLMSDSGPMGLFSGGPQNLTKRRSAGTDEFCTRLRAGVFLNPA